MAAPGSATAAAGGPRADEPTPGAPPAAAAPAPEQAPPQPAAPPQQQQQQQPSPAEQKYQPPPAPPPPQQPAAPAPPRQEDCSFLPLVHDIIKCIDKDSQDVHQVLNELRTKFVEVRKLIKTMQGIGASPEQQQLQLQNLREQVRTKNELLQKYKSLCMFEIPKE